MSAFCIFYCAGMGAYGAYFDSDSAIKIVDIFIYPSFIFAFGAFGIDSASKQFSHKYNNNNEGKQDV